MKLIAKIVVIALLPVAIVLGFIRWILLNSLASFIRPLQAWTLRRISQMTTEELKEKDARLSDSPSRGKWVHRQVMRELDRRNKLSKHVLNGLNTAETVNIGLS